MVNVTKTFLPPKADYITLLEHIWETSMITNRGPLVLQLEDRLKKYLDVCHILLTSNGTLSLQLALKTLPQGGDVITTPFSYVATTSSICWEGYNPVFVDIDKDFLTINEEAVESAITKKTVAILATHVFGNPCHVEKLDQIGKANDIPIIYDSAHAFGVRYKERSLLDYGDINTCSFHATKLFHTGEGGAIICKDERLAKKIYYLHNFGHDGYENYYSVGINAKMSELQAAMGLAVLPYMDQIINQRRRIVEMYDERLQFVNVRRQKIREHTKWNYSYYPIVFNSENKVRSVLEELNRKNIFPRRYFYPSLDTLPYLNVQKQPISQSVACKIICLPLFVGLEEKNIDIICDAVNRHAN